MVLSDYNQECFICRLPDCDMTNDRCGMARGVKYGLYPKSIIKSPTSGINRHIVGGDTVGFKEIPVFTQNDNMKKFCKEVGRYEE